MTIQACSLPIYFSSYLRPGENYAWAFCVCVCVCWMRSPYSSATAAGTVVRFYRCTLFYMHVDDAIRRLLCGRVTKNPYARTLFSLSFFFSFSVVLRVYLYSAHTSDTFHTQKAIFFFSSLVLMCFNRLIWVCVLCYVATRPMPNTHSFIFVLRIVCRRTSTSNIFYILLLHRETPGDIISRSFSVQM